MLAIIDSWDGNGCNIVSPGFPGPDTFNVSVDGSPVFSEVFENSSCGTQTYVPPAGVELARRLSLGFSFSSPCPGTFYCDSAYNMGLDPVFQNIPHTASTLTVDWFAGGSGWQGGTDESWAIDNVEVTVNRPPDCSNAASSVGEIWPPNHKMVNVKVLGVTDPDGDVVVIVISGIRQDEPVNGVADGDTSPDGAGVGTDTAQVRAERAGSKKVPGDGRMYHISYTADDGKGGTCAGEVLAGVPHDQGQGATIVDGGPLYDSTLP